MMKKNNKKGFTLAELLIVIAIIAILIAIAIPAFSASLHSARLQTDHGNIRSAYAIFRTAEMLNTMEEDGEPIDTLPASATWYFQKDGTFSKTNTTAETGAYACMTDPKAKECEASVGCDSKYGAHEEGALISISYNSTGDPKWTFKVAKPAGAGA